MLLNSICSFKTIPNGLRQQSLAAAIIPFAVTVALRGKLPDPSFNYVARFIKTISKDRKRPEIAVLPAV